MNHMRENSFDLNTSHDIDAGDVEVNVDEEAEVPLVIHSSSPETLVIDLNVDPNQEFEVPLMEVDLNQLHEEEEEVEEDIEAPNSVISQQVNGRSRRCMVSNDQRWKIYYALLARSESGKLKRDTTTKEVSEIFGVSLRTVQRIWKRAKDTTSSGSVDVSHRKTKNCGRKRIQVGLNQIAGIKLHRRTTLRSLAMSLGVSHATLHRRLRQGLLRRHSNAIKPLLREENKRARLRFCISMLNPNSISHEPKFVNMYNVVHIDEKWFYMTKKSETYYLHPAEEEPLRTCQSKNFIGKVMLLAAIARPRFDDNGNEVFSGKIGIFPFVIRQPAQRRSRNRPAGTMEIKPITSVTKETIREYLIEKVIPAIQAKWLEEDSRKTIFIQQDNARTHINANDEEFTIVASQNGFDIRIVCQPANSPDLNILDLGFFNAIQSLQHKECPKTVEELIHVVEKSFDEYPTSKVNHVFLTLQKCMEKIMEVGGSNKYKIPHINKIRLERDGCLPEVITCDHSLVQGVLNILA